MLSPACGSPIGSRVGARTPRHRSVRGLRERARVGYTDAEKESIRDLYGSPVSIDITFAGGEQIELGDRQLSVLHARVTRPATSCSTSRRAVSFQLGRRALALLPGCRRNAALPRRMRTSSPTSQRSTFSSRSPRLSSIRDIGQRAGAPMCSFLGESREFVGALDTVLQERSRRLRRFASSASMWNEAGTVRRRIRVNLMFVVHGHLRRLAPRDVRTLDPNERPWRFELRRGAR